MSTDQNRQEIIDTIRKLIDDIHIAMLTTVATGEVIRSRPMITAKHPFDGDLWFFTRADDPKVEEIKLHPEVNVAYSAPNNDRYVSMAGRAELVNDRKRIETLWDDSITEWFPGGPTDENLALLRIDVTEAEYWDSKASRMGGFVKSFMGTDEQATKHEKISWSEAVTIT